MPRVRLQPVRRLGLLAVAVLSCLVVATHHPWHVEAQAVQQARRGAPPPAGDDGAAAGAALPPRPTWFYGTAWKKKRTAELVQQALRLGFRAVDTANQDKHYNEAGVGAGLAAAYRELGLARRDVFLQTKYSHGQWRGSSLSFADQVRTSIKQSLEHLGTDYLDSVLLHGPLDRSTPRLPSGDWQAWHALEEAVQQGTARSIGLSNVNRLQLLDVIQRAKIKPAFVQLRTFANEAWGSEIRAVCKEYGIVYQGYSLLTANRYATQRPAVQGLATRLGITPAQLVFRYSVQLGMAPITGSSSAAHLKQDLLATTDFPPLKPEQLNIMADSGVGAPKRKKRRRKQRGHKQPR